MAPLNLFVLLSAFVPAAANRYTEFFSVDSAATAQTFAHIFIALGILVTVGAVAILGFCWFCTDNCSTKVKKPPPHWEYRPKRDPEIGGYDNEAWDPRYPGVRYVQ